MIRHIVMFKLQAFDTPTAKQLKLLEIKKELEALKPVIACLRSIRVDFNANPEEVWDLILTTELDSLEDVKAYATHPAHVAVSKNVIAPVKADRACVDYVL